MTPRINEQIFTRLSEIGYVGDNPETRHAWLTAFEGVADNLVLESISRWLERPDSYDLRGHGWPPLHQIAAGLPAAAHRRPPVVGEDWHSPTGSYLTAAEWRSFAALYRARDTHPAQGAAGVIECLAQANGYRPDWPKPR